MFTKYDRTNISVYMRILFSLLIVSVLVFNPDGIIPSQATDITFVVDTLIDSNDLEYQVCSDSPGDCSLRGAISTANADFTNRYNINLPSGTYNVSLPGASENDNSGGDIDIKGNISLTGTKAGVTLQGNQVDRVFHIHSTADVLINNIHISGGRTPDGVDASDGELGGGIYNQGSLILKNSVIVGNRAGNGTSATAGLNAGKGGSGGGIQNDGILTVEDSIVSANMAGTGGDGYNCRALTIYCIGREAGNGGVGGGINNAGFLTIINSLLINNQAGLAGLAGSSIINDTISLPGQPGSGGGIANQGYMKLDGSALQENQGKLGGGGLSNSGYAYLLDTTISGNNASAGGGLRNQNYLVIEESLLVSNSGDEGGGIYNEDELHMLASTISGSNAALGGGMYNKGDAYLVKVVVQDNWTRDGSDGEDEIGGYKYGPRSPTDGSSPHGGGIYNISNMEFDQGGVSGNATGDGGNGGNAVEAWYGANGGNGGFGGGIYNTGRIILNFTPVINNTTGDGGKGGTGQIFEGRDGEGGYGGGIFSSGEMIVTFSPVINNQTGTGDGGVGCGGGIANQGEFIYSYGTIADNQTSPAGNGGGVYTNGVFLITGSKVVSNTAGGDGGGIFTVGGTLSGINDIFARNSISSGHQGSGLFIFNSNTELFHTSLAQNTGGDGSGIAVVEANLQMTNTILVDHTIGISVASGAEAVFESTLWGAGSWANEVDWAGSGSITSGTNNYWLDPGFVDPLNLDYHIGSSSAAIDRGIYTEIINDLDNQPRPNSVSGIADLGADEYWETIPISEVDVSGPITGKTYTPITFTASIIPEAATPNIHFYWVPPPDSGQWTNTVSYLWTRPGVMTLEVTAINAGSMVTEPFTISLEAAVLQFFLPVVGQSTNMGRSY
jgi:hypothetical protein